VRTNRFRRGLRFSEQARITAFRLQFPKWHLKNQLSKETSVFTNLLTTTAQTNFANQLQAFMTLAHTAIDGGTKILELNLSLGKARFDQSSTALNELVSGGPQEYLPLVAKQARENLESAFSHCSYVALLMANSQAELTKIVHAKIHETQSDSPAKNTGATKKA
jgi:hypothetical protein